jgi:TIR domain
MDFEGDAFISYAHMDNVELVEGRKGWVANLHRALEVRVGQLLGKPLQVWRDPKLSGNDVFADALVDRLKRVATLISIVSPRYVKSEWTRRELTEFWKAAEEQGGVSFQNKARIFKILKTPVPLDQHPPELRSLLGYEFFKIDPETGRVRELDEVFGPEAQRDFWLKLDDLAHDICCLLEMLEAPGGAPLPAVEAGQRAVYVAETASDLKEQREAIRRDLQQHGYTVLPALALPQVAEDLEASVRADLAQCVMSIHPVGRSYSLTPEGGELSIVEMQNELAVERGEKGGFSRLVWIPSGLEVKDERQRKVIEKLRMDPRVQTGADLLETTLEDLRTVYQERLKQPEEPAQEPAPQPTPSSSEGHQPLYLIYDQQDSALAPACVDYLYKQGFEVLRPVFDGDEADIREEHEESLRSCDGALILYGAACECWLRRKLRELQKSPGFGRTKPKPVVAISLLPPRNAEKETFRTHEAILIPQMDGFSPDPLGPFISRLKN